MHHRLTEGERFDQWYEIRRGKASIVIGARSAVFAPLPRLGLIIVDEEHEGSYKQTEESPAYSARDLAVMRGKLQSAAVVLGSATPALESYYNAIKGKYHLFRLTKRATSFDVPQITLVDMKPEYEKAKGATSFSSVLLQKIKERYQKGEQTLLFLNRRGYHTSLVCIECSHVVSCPQCAMALTFHFKEHVLACHLCDYRTVPLRICPECRQPTFQYKGVGTEKIERMLKGIFPDIRTLRIDADTTRHTGSYEKLYNAFKNQKADVLIGTQMIAKGLHFPGVTLACILNCDGQLNLPDFRTSEVTFRLLTQVAGRAGRGDIPGEVIIQTLNPDNAVLLQAIRGDYEKFFEQEMDSRRFFSYPPLEHLIKISFKGKEEKRTLHAADEFYRLLLPLLKGRGEVGPPVPCGYPKIKEYYRFQILLKGPSVFRLNEAVERVEATRKKEAAVRYLVDVDPLSTFG